MTLTLERTTIDLGSGDGGLPARRAVVRWAWRLFFREWRQQLLILALIIVAVAITVVGAGVAVNTPTPSKTGFGTANALIQLPGSDPKLASTVATLEHKLGTVDVIDNQTVPVPGSLATYDLRAQNPDGTYGKAMLAVVSGRYPRTAGEVAVTSGVAAAYGLRVGGLWHRAGVTRHVVGIVQNPQNLLDEFALVPPGQGGGAGQVTLLFDATPAQLGSLGLHVHVQTPPDTLNGGFNPEIFVILIATVGMLLIGLVSVGGFTVLAQRRLRSIGMLGALGATDKNIRLVVRANGLAVGLVGTLVGGALGLLAWIAYRPHVEQASHHLIGTFQLPWLVILPAMALAVVTTWFAASRPAKAVTRVPVVTALSGRPAPPRQLHRSALPRSPSPWAPTSCCSTPARARGTVAGPRNSSSASSSSRWDSSCSPRRRSPPSPLWPGTHHWPCGCPCATWSATGPGRARPSVPSVSACSSPPPSASPPPPVTGTCSTTPDRTWPTTR